MVKAVIRSPDGSTRPFDEKPTRTASVGVIVDGEPVHFEDWLKVMIKDLKAPVSWDDWRREIANVRGAQIVYLAPDPHDDTGFLLEVGSVRNPVKRRKVVELDRLRSAGAIEIRLTMIVGAIGTLDHQQVKALDGLPAEEANTILRSDMAWIIADQTDTRPSLAVFSPSRWQTVRPKGLE